MSQLISLCRAVLNEHFGSVVGQVGEVLLKESAQFGILVFRLKDKVSLAQIRKALAILEQHNLVSFELVNAQRIVYKVNPWDVLMLLKIPRCGLIIKTLYQDVAESIYEEIIKEGRMTLSDTLRKMKERNPSLSFEEARSKFETLAKAEFIIREPPIDCYIKGCPIFAQKFEQFEVPAVTEAKVYLSEPPANRKRKAESGDSDAGIYWKINWMRFERYIRDELILDQIVGSKTNSPRDQLFRGTITALLKACETRATTIFALETVPVSLYDIIKTANDEKIATIEKGNAAFVLSTIIDESNGVLRKIGESGGGLYVIDYGRGMQLLAQSHIESLIREQLDTKAVRIFRLLQRTGYLEEEQIEKLIMLNPKETRELLYAMNEENYVFVQPLGKTSDFAPARTFYLYRTDFNRTVRLVEESTCKFLLNLMLRREHEEKEHRALLDRNEKMEAIIAENVDNNEELDEAARSQQRAEIEQIYMNDADRTLLGRHKNAKKKLMGSEIEIERVLYLLHTHLVFAERAIPMKKRGRTRKPLIIA
ncbi:unnamed protein product, partial [Mesorhabditis belari]|uniref:DNA-directed RNA polymerase III subunit RPC3 n=1 Tax=Mesorhabditis belari TaxID=2138241 RepID=A0AAF3EX80_9BILA